MDKRTKKSKDMILKGIKKAMEGIFKASADAQPLNYTDGTGCKHQECAGVYNSAMTRAIAHDMMSLALFLYTKNKGLADKVKSAAADVRECDIVLRRMFDDRRDNRPVCNFPSKKTYDAIECLAIVKKSKYANDPMVKHYIGIMKVWLEKIAKMNAWAYYCECQEEIRYAAHEADMRAFDNDGNQVYGMSKKDAECVKIMLSMEQIMLKAFIRIPFRCKESDDCMNKIEIIKTLIKAIIENDTDKLNYLENYANAATKESPK